MKTNIPSIDPAEAEDFVGMFRHIFGKFMQNTDDMLPAKVISYNRGTNRAKVQPLIMMMTTDDSTISRAPIASIPVFQYGAGGFMMSFPVSPGDLGWIKANDRDISLYLQQYKESAPNTLRKKSFSDAIFLPDVLNGYTIAGEDTSNLVIQNLDGSVKVALWSNKIKVAAPTIEAVATTSITANAPDITATASNTMTVSGTTSVTVSSSTLLTLSAPTINLNGATAINITAPAIGITGALTNGGVNIGSTHTHAQGPDSGGNTEQNTGVPM